MSNLQISNYNEKIEKIYKDGNKFYIETIKNGRRWYSYIKLHNELNLNKKTICEFILNDKKTDENIIKNYIGYYIIEKKVTQYEDYHPAFNIYEVLHLTKLEFKLSDEIIIGMRIGEIYENKKDKFIGKLEHSGGDGFLD